MVTETDLFRALGDPTRKAVYERLAVGEATVSELTAGFAVSQSAISQHLAVLRKAGLVLDSPAGKSTLYRANPAGLRPLASWLDRFQDFWRDHLAQLNDVLEEMDE